MSLFVKGIRATAKNRNWKVGKRKEERGTAYRLPLIEPAIF
jgi:hypothetical protein